MHKSFIRMLVAGFVAAARARLNATSSNPPGGFVTW
jgi:hypothetical protein